MSRHSFVMTAKLLRAWIFALAWAGLIWTVSSSPLQGPLVETASKKHLDKLAHAVEYGLFAVLLFEALRRSIPGRGRVRRALILSAFVCAVFAVADEIHQTGVRFRCSSVADLWADLTGIVLALGARLWRLSKKHA